MKGGEKKGKGDGDGGRERKMVGGKKEGKIKGGWKAKGSGMEQGWEGVNGDGETGGRERGDR